MIPATAISVPVVAHRVIFSRRKITESGRTNTGSVEISVLATQTSAYLMATSDSQNPPKVTMITAIKNRPAKRRSRNGFIQAPNCPVDAPRRKTPIVPASMRISVASIVDTVSSAFLAMMIDTDMLTTEASPNSTPRRPILLRSPD